MKKDIVVYTDGSSRGNPGKGGYGIVMRYGNYRKEFSQGYKLTTNNRMELLAVIVALENITKPGIDVHIHSDSKYVIDSITKGWVNNWKKKGFKGKKNPDLWKRFLDIYPKYNVKFTWVKGHANIPENEKCDELAVNAALGNHLLDDIGYKTTW